MGDPLNEELEVAFDAFLDKIDFPKIYPEIRATAMRYIWSIRDIPTQSLMKELYGSEFRRFPSAEEMDQFGELFVNLWNGLLDHQNEGNYFRFNQMPLPQCINDIQSRVYIRNLEVQALYPLLSDDRVPAENKAEQKVLVENIGEEIEKLHRVIRETLASDEVSLSGWTQRLNEIDVMLEESFNQVGWLYMRIRREHPELKSFAVVHADKVGRNDPCPCGSGKKYKNCCLGKK